MSSKEIDCILMVWIVVATISTVGCQVESSQGEISLENGGLCDTGETYNHDSHYQTPQKCTSVIVHGQNFRNWRNLTCHFKHTSYKCLDPDNGCTEHEIIASTDHGYHDNRAKFINSTTVMCKLYEAKAFNISVNYDWYTNEPISPQALYLPYSSLCQTCNAETVTCVSTFSQMKKYCRFENKCTALDGIHPKYRCRKCGTADNGTLIWEDVISVDCGYAVLPAWSIVLLVIAAIALIVVIGFLVHACFFKSGDASTYNRVLENGATTSDATSSDPVEPNPQT